jgi:DNA-binding LacI/PurR family transcriptional regulator
MRMIARPITTRDVAEAAGVNQSTVSRALRNDPKIRPEVRAKIRKCADKLGYRPNPFVSAFSAQVRSYRRSPNGAVLALLDCNDKKDSETSMDYRRGAEKRAAEHGFTPELFSLHRLDFSFKRLNQLLWTRAISGLLVLPVPLGFDLSGLDFSRLATSTVDPTLHSPRLHRAEPDYFQGMQLGLKILEERGYRRITFCTTRHEVNLLDEEWLGGFTGWQAMKPAAERMEPFIGENWEPGPFKKWFKEHRPDAIIANTHLYFRFCREMGHKPPDVAHVSLSAGPEHPGLAGISQNQDQVGAAAVDTILAQIHRNDYGLPAFPKKLLIQGTWVEGASVRRVPGARSRKK